MDFQLPELGEGVQEGEVIKWLVAPGDKVSVDQPLLEVMTDKATVEVPASSPGVVKELKVAEGAMVKIGQVIAVIESGASASAPPKVSVSQVQNHPPAKPQTPTSGNGSVHEDSSKLEIRAVSTPTAIPKSGQGHSAPSASGGSLGFETAATRTFDSDTIPAAPIVRAMAQKAGVDLSQVRGTGPKVGDKPRVLEADLIAYLNSGQATHVPTAHQAPTRPAAPTPRPATPKQTSQAGGAMEERKPLRGLRRLIAQSMVKSKFTAPHYSYVDEFECTDLMKFREQVKPFAESQGVKISYLPFIIKAVVAALKEFPIVNSSLEDADNGQELVFKKYYHIGFAVSTEEGLIVPVIKNADQKSIIDIARELTELSDKVRANKATADELRGSTFTITSMGNLAGIFAMPIINYPEAGILGVYKIQQKPVVAYGQIVVGNMMTLSLSLDHRIVDGAVGSKFCSAIIHRLANPAQLVFQEL